MASGYKFSLQKLLEIREEKEQKAFYWESKTKTNYWKWT